MLYQNVSSVTEISQAMYKMVSDPAEYFLEYRIIPLDLAMNSSNESYGLICDDCNISYSILIVLYDRYGGTETKFLYDLTRDLDEAKSLQKLLCEGAVMPYTANEVVGDLL